MESVNGRKTTEKPNYAMSTRFIIDDDALMNKITPITITKELETSPIGRQALQYVADSKIFVQLVYEIRSDGIRGYQYKNEIKVFISNTKNDKIAAQSVIHELTHHYYNDTPCIKAEARCFCAEKQHLTKRALTYKEIKQMIMLAKKTYANLPWR